MIGVFDSGYGGLTILKDLLKVLPQYDYFYLGDNARTPYGNRSAETVLKFTEEAIDFLFKNDCRLIIVACNTASGLALRSIQQKYLRDLNISDKKILGVIRPQVEQAIKVSQKKAVGIVGTRGSIQSRTFEKEFEHLAPEIKVHSQACPLLVPLVEEGWNDKPEAKMILKKYLRPLKSSNVDTLVLGCTHYPFFYKEFCRYMGKNVKVIEPGKVVAESLKDYLKRHPEIESLLEKNAQLMFTTTDDPDRFKEIGEKFLGFTMKEVKKVTLTS